MALMKSVSGVRGVFGEDITPFDIMRFAANFGIRQNRGTIVVGRDSRLTGSSLAAAACAGLTAVGCNVINLGIAATPTVLLAVEELEASGGLSVTASHNPGQWNALKFVDANGMFLFPEKAGDFLPMLDNDPVWADWENCGKIYEDFSASSRHIEKILSIPYLNVEEIRQRKFRVLADCVNGAGGVIVPTLLRELGCTVVELNCEPTGRFAHVPEPLRENLVDTARVVRQEGVDLAVVVDPDVDRLALIDENGEIVSEELTLPLAASFVLGKKQGPMVVNLSTSMASSDVAARFKVECLRTKVGEINVGKMMCEKKAAIGGEGNGGVICPEVHYTRDAPAGIALILGYLAQTGQTLSKAVAALPAYCMAKGKLELNPTKKEAALREAGKLYPEMALNTEDGFKYQGKDCWVHVRPSGTEPILRVYTEAPTQDRADELCQKTLELMKKKLG